MNNMPLDPEHPQNDGENRELHDQAHPGEFSSVKILRRGENGQWNDLGSQKIRKNTLEGSTTWGAKVRDIRL